jgi:hypothetical protein
MSTICVLCLELVAALRTDAHAPLLARLVAAQAVPAKAPRSPELAAPRNKYFDYNLKPKESRSRLFKKKP